MTEKALSYAGTFQATRLHTELVAAIPALVSAGPGGASVANYTLELLGGSGVKLRVPNAVADAAVDAVIAAHNPAYVTPLTLSERLKIKAAIAARTGIGGGRELAE